MCVFCKIINGELPSYKVYEDENNLAFLDIAPVNPGHVLLVSKKHYENMEEIPADDLCSLILAVKAVGRLLKEKLGVPGYNLSINNDPIAGQAVPHLHFHLMPRRVGDGHELWKHGSYAPGEAEEIIRKLSL